MGTAFFYHLTDSPLEATLPMLLNKARQAGWRTLVRSSDTALLARLDRVLWEGPADGFIPHGRSGGENDADQPVLLCSEASAELFDCIMCVGPAALSSSEVGLAERVCVLFDGHDPQALEAARTQWKALTGDGCVAEYWAQEDGRWTKKASST